MRKNTQKTRRVFLGFFQAFAAQFVAEIHSSYLTDSGANKRETRKTTIQPFSLVYF